MPSRRTIDLCLSVYSWAPFRSTKAATKLHTLFDLRGSIQTFIHISDGAHNAAGGRTVHAGPNRGVGARNPNRSPLAAGFQITEAEIGGVIAFLESLTDRGFTTDPRFADPFARRPPGEAD